jgi:tetratricopeptide (TPR) repeat protein
VAYEKILASEKANWQVYYNLGNAHYKQKQFGKAILNYERALRLNSDNEDIDFNLDLANLSVTDRITAMPRSLIVIWLDRAIHFFTIESAAILTAIFWVLLFTGAIIWMLARRQVLQNWGRRIAWIAGSVWLVFAMIFASLSYEPQPCKKPSCSRHVWLCAVRRQKALRKCLFCTKALKCGCRKIAAFGGELDWPMERWAGWKPIRLRKFNQSCAKTIANANNFY